MSINFANMATTFLENYNKLLFKKCNIQISSHNMELYLKLKKLYRRQGVEFEKYFFLISLFFIMKIK